MEERAKSPNQPDREWCSACSFNLQRPLTLSGPLSKSKSTGLDRCKIQGWVLCIQRPLITSSRRPFLCCVPRKRLLYSYLTFV